MRRLIFLILNLFAFLFLSTPLSAGNIETAEEILAASDAVRNPDRPYSLNTLLIEYRDGREQGRMALTVYSKEMKQSGEYRSLIRFVEPARDKDKLMLINGNILWFYDPSSKRSVRISPQQRLMGQASNGDVVTVNFHNDYAAKLEGEETITDTEKKARACYRLNLQAVDTSITYHRIEYWVDKENFHPVKGKFYSESDRLLKIVYYRGYREQLGKMRPTEVIIIDGVDRKLVTKMLFSDYSYRVIPEEWFQEEYLLHFKGE
jgi:outer membrane lipoprotein-sorting protein